MNELDDDLPRKEETILKELRWKQVEDLSRQYEAWEAFYGSKSRMSP